MHNEIFALKSCQGTSANSGRFIEHAVKGIIASSHGGRTYDNGKVLLSREEFAIEVGEGLPRLPDSGIRKWRSGEL